MPIEEVKTFIALCDHCGESYNYIYYNDRKALFQDVVSSGWECFNGGSKLKCPYCQDDEVSPFDYEY